MAEKISTLVLKVDLNCPKCYKKIRKVLCHFRCKIQTQTFDLKQNTVTISGPFDPCCFSRKLCCKAGKVIECIEIVKPKPPPPPPPKEKPPPPPPKETPPPPPPKETPPPPPPKETPPPPPPPKPKSPKPVCPVPCYPAGVCDDGCGWGPCCHGRPVMPESCYCGCGGRAWEPCYCGCGGRREVCYCGCGGRPAEPVMPAMPVMPVVPVVPYSGWGRPQPCYCGCGGRERCCGYFSEENPNSCSVM